jgi:hypothetical protein
MKDREFVEYLRGYNILMLDSAFLSYLQLIG